MVTHRVAPDTIQYTGLFVQPEFRGQRLALALLAESVRCQIASGCPHCVCQVEADNEPMMRFVNQLRPYLTSLTELRCSRKHLRSEAKR